MFSSILTNSLSWIQSGQKYYLTDLIVITLVPIILFSSIHPYIFFNPDHETLTFLGFRVDLDGNLLDPQTGETIGEQLMSRHLRTGLHVQKVDLNNDFESCSKYVSTELCVHDQ